MRLTTTILWPTCMDEGNSWPYLDIPVCVDEVNTRCVVMTRRTAAFVYVDVTVFTLVTSHTVTRVGGHVIHARACMSTRGAPTIILVHLTHYTWANISNTSHNFVSVNDILVESQPITFQTSLNLVILSRYKIQLFNVRIQFWSYCAKACLKCYKC